MASTPFGVPSELDNEALEKALADAHSKGAELAKINDEDFTDEQVEELSSVAEFISNAKSEQEAREQAKAEKAEKIAQLRDAVVVKKDDEEDEDEEKVAEGEEITPADEETPAEEEEEDEDKKRPFSADTETSANESVETAAEEASTDEAFAEAEEEDEPEGESNESSDQEDRTDGDLPDEGTTEEEESDDVAENKASLANAAKHAPKAEAVEGTSKFAITAAANVQGVNAGKNYSTLSEAGEAVQNSLKALPTSGKGRTKLPALTFSVEHEYTQGVTGNDSETLLSAASESRLKDGSLVAAGGWAAPSEQLLDFCSIETADGLIDLPGITVNRGGVNYTKGPSFEDVLNSSTGFWDMTETQAESGTFEKTSLMPETPTFTDVRLDAVGVMVEAGLLTRHGWPELVERYSQLAVLAHQVKVHNKLINGITGYTGDAVQFAGGYGNAIDVLNVLDAVIAGERQRFSMGNNATVEALVPVWMKSALRSDLANRAGVDLLDVPESRINGWFTARGARVQWLSHWQDLSYTDGIVQGYPETVEIIVYPAGTYVKGEEDVITLDTVYDSENLKRNQYVHLFMEQGILVANPCYQGRRFEIPLSINGRTAANDITSNFGEVADAEPAA